MTVSKTIPSELLDTLLSGYQKPEDLIGECGLLKQLTKARVEHALEVGLTEHLGHGKHEPVTNPSGNARNGKSRKSLKGDFGELPIEIPRDRHGSFEPQIVAKHQTRWTGFDDKIISRYARGMTVREIQSHLEELYGAEVSPSLICSATDTRGAQVRLPMKLKPGNHGRWSRFIRLSISTAYTSKCATPALCESKPSIWRWEST